MLARSLEEFIAPLRAEVARLETEVRHLRAQIGVSEPPRTPVAIGSTAAATLRAAIANTEVARRTGRINTAAQSCMVTQCEAPVLAKELCETHYRIMRRAIANGEEFDLAAQRPAAAREVARGCSVADCTDAHYAKQLCRRHYMAARARLRNQGIDPAEHADDSAAGAYAAGAVIDSAGQDEEQEQPSNGNGYSEVDASGEPIVAPTAEVVARVLAQYRGGLIKVAEVLGRNKRSLMQLLDHLNLMQHAIDLRKNERRRILAASLRERLSDLLFREKLLEDLDCMKEVDERTRAEVTTRLAALGRNAQSVEDALGKLAMELQLEDAAMSRLIYRYDLRRQLRDMKLKSAPAPRARY
jgi:hypothetical protein